MIKKHSSFVFAILMIFSLLISQDRGFKVVAKTSEGETIELYKGCYALVIGVSDYQSGWPDLPNATRDADEIGDLLSKIGFKVTRLKNPTKAQFIQAFENFVYVPGQDPNNCLVIFFAGHGYTHKLAYGSDMGYIVPKDAPLPSRDKAGFMQKAIDMQTLEAYARRIQAKHALFLFDSCFSGAIFDMARAVPAAISYKTARPVRQFITAGGSDEPVPDRSIFKSQLIEALGGEADRNSDGYITGTELGEFLQEKVINYSRNSQHPQYGKIRDPNLDKGDFVFALDKVKISEAEEAQLPPKPPKTTGIDLTSIEKAGEERTKIKKQWQSWQTKMQSDFKDVEKIDKSQDYTQEEKINAWDKFLYIYIQDNPFSNNDENIRKRAKDRHKYWKEFIKISISTSSEMPCIAKVVHSESVLKNSRRGKEAMLKIQDYNQELERKVRKNKLTSQEADIEMKRYRTKIFNQVQNEILPIIEEIGKMGGYSFILDLANSGTIYFDPMTDITDLIVKKYNGEKFSIQSYKTMIDELKIGLVNSQSVLGNSRRGKEAILKLQDYDQELKRKVRNNKLTPQEADIEMKRYRNEIFNQVQNEVLPIIEEIGKMGGYSFILDLANSGTIYFDPMTDITDLIVKKYNGEKFSIQSYKTMIDELKIGLVNSNSVLQNSRRGKEAMLKLQGYDQKLKQKVRKNKLTSQEADIEMKRYRNEIFNQVQNEVLPIIEEIGKMDKYTLIFDVDNSGAISFFEDLDITKVIIKKYDEKKVEISVGARISLRSIPRSLREREAESMLKKRGFFDSIWNKSKDFRNKYEAKTISGYEVIIDHLTGLMWHQS